jgi:hypothetical protein
MMVLNFPPFESMCALLRSFVQDLAGAHDIFVRDQTASVLTFPSTG